MSSKYECLGNSAMRAIFTKLKEKFDGLSSVATTGKYSDLTGCPDLSKYCTVTQTDEKIANAITKSLNTPL